MSEGTHTTTHTTIDDRTNVPLFVAIAATVAIVGGVISFVVFAMKIDNRLTLVEATVARIESTTAGNTSWSSFVNFAEDLQDRNPTLLVPKPRR